VEYVDPFKSLNDIKRMEREALLNSPASHQQHKSPATTIASSLSRRDYFAASALQGTLASNCSVPDAVQRAVMAADFLIEMLEHTEGEVKP
jgi:hypothetical protein